MQQPYSEKEVLADALTAEKTATDHYNTFANECVHENVRNAILDCLDKEHAIQQDVFNIMHGKGYYPTPAAEMQKFYKPFFDVNVGVDVIPEDRDFSKYQVLILPQMIIHKPEMEAKVKAFAEQGGTVVLTYRCSVKDANNNVPFGKTAPVGYNEFAGHCVVETESLQTLDAFPVVGTGAFAKYNGMGGIFRDMIEVKDAEILFRYGDTFYDSFAAVTRKPAGKGMVYYIGCGLEESITKALMETIMKEKEIPMYPSQNGVEIVTRGEKEQQIKMYINHNGTEAEEDGVKLAPFECVIKSIN